MGRYLTIFITYCLTTWYIVDYSYNSGLREQKKELNKGQALCKAEKHTEAYVAFDGYGGMRCFIESTQYPHKAKGSSIVYIDNKE